MTSNVIYEGNLRTVAMHLKSGTPLETDAPTDNHGKGERFSPTDLVATALASCMLTTMGIKMQELEPSLEDVQISVEKIMSNNPRRISGLNLTFHLPKNFNATDEQKSKLEEIAWTCPVKQSINPEIDLKINFNW